MNIIIENERIRVEFDDATGGILSVTDLMENTARAFSSWGFSLTSEGRTYFRGAKAESAEKTEDGAEFLFRDGGFTARLRCSLLGDGAFLERELSFLREDGESWSADKIVCDDAVPAQAPSEVLFHDDQTLWHVPTNYFIRYEGGGLCCGLEYPWWDEAEEDPSLRGRITLGFSPRHTVPAGERFTAEKTFWGVYRAEGIYRKANGPYPGKIKLPYRDGLFEGCGLHQHIKDMKIPEDMGLPVETLDWGEVWAMQDFFARHLPLLPLPEDGWWIWQNGWWANLFSPDTENLEPLARAEVRDVLTAAMYFGHDLHPSTEPKYIRNMRIDPPGFPVYETPPEGVGVGNNALHHYVADSPEDKVIGYTDTFEAPPAYDAFIKKAEELGMHVASFSTPNTFFRQKPEWGAIREDGTPHEYFNTRLSCPACREYMDFQFEVICRVLDRYSPRMWSFDGRWLNYREIAGYHFEWIGTEPCFSAKHGHPVGESKYDEWKNIEKFKAKLRRRYPTTCFEQYYGLKRGGIWSLANLNSDENYYEMGSVENNRLQTWHNENGRFRPMYLNYASIFGDTPAEFELSIVSCLSTSYYCQLSCGFHALKDYPESAEIFKKWKRWADNNMRFLKSRRSLFGMPGEFAADGSAHIVGDEGLIFLFTAPGKPVDARIPLTRRIGLDEKPGREYRITVEAAVHAKGGEAGCALTAPAYSYGSELRCRLTPDSAVILRLEPCGDETLPVLPAVPFAEDDETVEAFPSYAE